MGELINLFASLPNVTDADIYAKVNDPNGALAQDYPLATRNLKTNFPTIPEEYDTSDEKYHFIFVDVNFRFGGGEFTTELLKRLDPKREALIELVKKGLEVNFNAPAYQTLREDTLAMLVDLLRSPHEGVICILEALKTPTALDVLMKDERTQPLMRTVLALILSACYVPFDLKRMKRQRLCSLDYDPTLFLKELNLYFELEYGK